MEQTTDNVPLNSEVISHIDETVNGKWDKLEDLKMTDEESKAFGSKIKEIASQSATKAYESNELLKHNNPSLINATKKYIECFVAGVQYLSEESKNNLKRDNPDFDNERVVIDKELIQYGINSTSYPNEGEMTLMSKMAREAFLTGRAIARMKGDTINGASLGIATFRLLDESSRDRVAENIKDIMEIANAREKDLGTQLDYFLRQNK